MSEMDDEGRTAVQSSGNVFADLGLASMPKDMLKVEIARAISKILRELTQAEAARRIDADQARVSNLLRGRLTEFAVDRLLKYLVLLGHDIDMRLSPTPAGAHGTIKVSHVD